MREWALVADALDAVLGTSSSGGVSALLEAIDVRLAAIFAPFRREPWEDKLAGKTGLWPD